LIKLITAYTNEVDDIKKAINEIYEQLDIKTNMRKNTIGIVHYYYEYDENGVLQILTDILPFKIVGSVSIYLTNGKKYGDTALSVTMLTGDDVEFQMYSIDNVGNKTQEEINYALEEIYIDMKKSEKPKLALTYMPTLSHYSVDNFINRVNKDQDPILFFGNLAYYVGTSNYKGHIFINGRTTADTIIFIAIYGKLEPEFHISSSFSLDDDLMNEGEITDVDGSILKTINGISAVQYLKEQGMMSTPNTLINSTTWLLPAILVYPNGLKIVRAFPSIVEGTEYIYTTGSLEKGSKIKFSFLDGEKTLASARKFCESCNILRVNDVLTYSCGARAWSLGLNNFGEVKTFIECSKNYESLNKTPINFTVAYAGGEICPILDKTGKLINALHHYSLVACSFNKLDPEIK